MCSRLLAVAVVPFLTASVCTAQALKNLNPFVNIPEVQVTIDHPPRLGHQIMEIKKIAFGRPEGECAGELVDSLISVFVTSGVEVLNRQNVEQLLDEHEFATTGLVDRQSAQELGKILGPTALVFVTVRRCDTVRAPLQNHRRSRVSGRMMYEYISKTTAYLKGSIQVVDLSTAQIYSARTLDETATKSFTSETGPPEFPDAYEMKDQAITQSVERVRQMFFPWREFRTVRFYNDKLCNMKLAYNLVKSGDLPSAIEQSRTNVEICRAEVAKKPKLVARTLYNLGVVNCLAASFDAGLGALDESLRLRPHNPTSEAISQCRKAQEAARQMEQFQQEALAAGHVADADQAAVKPLAEELEALENLYRLDLLTQDMYRKRVESLLARRGAPGDTMEDKLRALKDYLDRGMISQSLYEAQVARILGD